MLHWDFWNNPLANDQLALDVEASHFEVGAASFQTLASGGYGPGLFSLRNVPKRVIYDWLNNFLLKRVTAYDGGGFRAYEGFIAEMRATVDNVTHEVLLSNLVTRARVRYTKAYLNGQTTTANVVLDDAVSQAKYGIKESSDRLLDLSGHGILTNAQAMQYGTTYLNRRRTPRGPKYRSRPGAPPERTMEFSLWGYETTLGFQSDNSAFKKATEIATLVKSILSHGHVQYLNLADLSGIATTGTLIPYNATADWKPVDEMIAEIVQYGDSNNRGLLFQVWEDRQPFLRARPTTLGVNVRSNENRVWSGTRAPLFPYRVRAGDYLQIEDYPAPLEGYADLDLHPGASLIASTNYDDLAGTLEMLPAEAETVELFFGRVKNGLRTIKKL